MRIEIPDEKVEALIHSLMNNYPEAGGGHALQCTSYDHKKLRFTFFDEETGRIHEITEPVLRVGVSVFITLILKGEYKNALSANLLSENMDWDAHDCDAFVQCAIFGEVRYG